MGYINLSDITYVLPDGHTLFSDVSFHIGEGTKSALIGANGAGKSTLLNIITGKLMPTEGIVSTGGSIGVMNQLVGMRDTHISLQRAATELAPPHLTGYARKLVDAEESMVNAEKRGKLSTNTKNAQIAYVEAITEWGDVGGYNYDVRCDTVSTLVLRQPWEETRSRATSTLSGGELKRFALQLLLDGDDEVLILDEPDNFLDVPSKRALESAIRESDKTILLVSHDREVLARAADQIVTIESFSTWVHGDNFTTWAKAREARWERLEELRRRWDEKRHQLREQMLMYKNKAAYNADMASRYRAAQTRLEKFEQAGPPQESPRDQNITMRIDGSRTGKRAIICDDLELDNLTFPFSFEAWYGDRIAVLGPNGTGKSHFLRLLAQSENYDGTISPASRELAPVAHQGHARLGARVRPGLFSQTHDHPELALKTLVEILWDGSEERPSLEIGRAMSSLKRYELAEQAEQKFATLSGGQQARFMILLLELAGVNCLLLDEPTDNLDLASAEALETGLSSFNGTVVAVTHDRWFTRGFDRFLHFNSDGEVMETLEPVWSV